MRLYEQKFESNVLLNFFDLWEYIERKLATDDGVILFAHPQMVFFLKTKTISSFLTYPIHS